MARPNPKQIDAKTSRWRIDARNRGANEHDLFAVIMAFAAGAISGERGDELIAGLPGTPLPESIAALSRPSKSGSRAAPSVVSGHVTAEAFVDSYLAGKRGDSAAAADFARMSAANTPKVQPDQRDPLAFADQHLRSNRAGERAHRERIAEFNKRGR